MVASRVSSAHSPARHPVQAGHTGAPTPVLARSQPHHPSNHLHGSRTSLFLVEGKRLFKDSLPTAAHLAHGARVTPSSSPGPLWRWMHGLRTEFPQLGGPSSTAPFPGSLECPPADAFYTPHPWGLKPGIQTALNECLWPLIQSHSARRQWAQGMVCPARRGWGHRSQARPGPRERWDTSDPCQIV